MLLCLDKLFNNLFVSEFFKLLCFKSDFLGFFLTFFLTSPSIKLFFLIKFVKNTYFIFYKNIILKIYKTLKIYDINYLQEFSINLLYFEYKFVSFISGIAREII